MSHKSFTNKLCSDHNQRVNDGNMRESPGKDFYLQIMVNPRYILHEKIKSIEKNNLFKFQKNHKISRMKAKGGSSNIVGEQK